MIELVKLIDVIVGFASPVVRNKLQRNELVIKLLKHINLDPDHPPADFTAVYQYTLVEYGIGKPRPVLEIFRQLEIQAVFRKALDQNNPALLLQEGERFLSSHTLGDQIRELGIDARREFYQFAAIFIEVAKRTRTPAEVLTNQRLESLNQQIGTVQERLTRLPTLEGMRTEIARLAAQSLALPAAESQDQQCRAFALAQQMKGWFETLGYRFETHEVWQDDYFEWVINIPVRRGRYDRILVRGMEGAAEIGDVGMLRQSVEQQHTDEGWLITTRRISRAARDEVEKSENAYSGSDRYILHRDIPSQPTRVHSSAVSLLLCPFLRIQILQLLTAHSDHALPGKQSPDFRLHQSAIATSDATHPLGVALIYSRD